VGNFDWTFWVFISPLYMSVKIVPEHLLVERWKLNYGWEVLSPLRYRFATDAANRRLIFASDRQGFRPGVNIARHYSKHFTVYSVLYHAPPPATCKLDYQRYRPFTLYSHYAILIHGIPDVFHQ
jgi:hypothetical protein